MKNIIHRQEKKTVSRDRPIYNRDTAISKQNEDKCTIGFCGKDGQVTMNSEEFPQNEIRSRKLNIFA